MLRSRREGSAVKSMSVFAEDPSSVLSIHILGCTTTDSFTSRGSAPFSGSSSSCTHVHITTQTQTHTHTKLKYVLLKYIYNLKPIQPITAKSLSNTYFPCSVRQSVFLCLRVQDNISTTVQGAILELNHEQYQNLKNNGSMLKNGSLFIGMRLKQGRLSFSWTLSGTIFIIYFFATMHNYKIDQNIFSTDFKVTNFSS